MSKRSFTINPVTASQERGTVKTFQNNRNENKYIEVKKANDGHSYARQYMKWDTPEGEVKNYTGAKDAKRGRYSRARLDTIDQMLEDYTPVEEATNVIASNADIISAVETCQPDSDAYVEYSYEITDDEITLSASGTDDLLNFDPDNDEVDTDLDYNAIIELEAWAARIADQLEAIDDDNDSNEFEGTISSLRANINSDWYSGMSLFGESGPYTYNGITYTAYLD